LASLTLYRNARVASTPFGRFRYPLNFSSHAPPPKLRKKEVGNSIYRFAETGAIRTSRTLPRRLSRKRHSVFCPKPIHRDH